MEHATWTGATLLLVLCGAILARIVAARRGRPVFIRRIAGLDHLDDALGRATEMGKPIVFSPGFGDLGQMSTYAGLACLEYAVRRAARFGLRVIVPVAGATMFPVAQDVARDACIAEGKPELYDANDVLYLSGDQNAFAAAVTGIMEREKVGAAFYFGSYGFESLLLAETGQRIGAIQVAATDSFFQVPFFIAACDYTIFGEELYAASAYISREPTMLGSLSGQDFGKVVVAALLIAGIVAATVAQFNGASSGAFNALVGLLGR
ncbi:MAG: hypothetical protein GX446_18285 [Chthonomonadales bacterium]|nr:hypothetical protein [Chthonomonadales bacterium]